MTVEARFAHHFPENAKDGSPLVILLHGRGSTEDDLLGLARLLPDDTLLVTPRAPFPATPWGYGPGWAWYQYLHEDRVVEETLVQSLKALDSFMELIDQALPVRAGRRVLGGFSQGGTTSLSWALTRPGRIDGVANLSGFLVSSPLVPVTELSVAGLSVFWGHGEQDPMIPFSLAERGRRRLREAGCELEAVNHPGGHQITAEEVAAFRAWSVGLG